MVGEILGLQNTRMAKIQSNQATMIGQHFRILGLHNDKIHNLISPWLEKFWDYRTEESGEGIKKNSKLKYVHYKTIKFTKLIAQG